VEYKGRQFEESIDTREKDLVGRLWAERSGGRCLFAMTVGQDFKNIDAAIQAPAQKKEWILNLIPRNKARPFETHLPVYTLKAAAGKFGNSQDVAEEGWFRVEGRKLDSQMFVAQVLGKSMEPKIPDGSYCIFRAQPAGSRHGKIVLAQCRGIADPDTGGEYTIKRYRSEKKHEQGKEPENKSVSLEPLNKAYKPIPINSEDGVDIIAEFLDVLNGH
jgi:SOS-response transcriptional repressor LexA